MKFLIFIITLIASLAIGSYIFNSFIINALFSISLSMLTTCFFSGKNKWRTLFVISMVITIFCFFIIDVFFFKKTMSVMVEILIMMIFSLNLFLYFKINFKRKVRNNELKDVDLTYENMGKTDYQNWISTNPSTGLKMNGVFDVGGNTLGQQPENHNINE
ncbi:MULTISPECIES: hypothetical protein [unclassified Providencia]|uniref:hypothetical protein n=1 Tax=unclassified Providencia TaxID=2633465 RepID=UPI00234AF318|nr:MULTISPECIES: hypothetical protein [unclassified Providencia]